VHHCQFKYEYANMGAKQPGQVEQECSVSNVLQLKKWVTNRLHCLVLLNLVLLCIATIASAENRLLVGISEYQHIGKLKNTLNDIRLLEKRLVELGFEVTSLEDPNLEKFRDTVQDFAFTAETADVALVYFAGHGVEFGGENFLVPVDINIDKRASIATTSVSLSELLLSVEGARQLRMVVLDSCRNDPFSGIQALQEQSATGGAGAAGSGLAAASPDRGTLVAFAAKAGSVAADGDGTNSPFVLARAGLPPHSRQCSAGDEQPAGTPYLRFPAGCPVFSRRYKPVRK